jgi:AraC-like DNA-binding protein
MRRLRTKPQVQGRDAHTASVTSVAMRLGYSDAAHFTRAFRRWETCSPIHYRKHLAEASGQAPFAAMEEGS